MKKIILIVSIALLSTFTSCALKPISSQYNFVNMDQGKVDLEKLGNGTVLLYNGANILHKLDNTARVNLWINDMPAGQLRPSEYVILNLTEGTYQFNLLHIDMVNMRSKHQVIVNNGTKVIMIKPTLTSNKLEVKNELPSNFEKFRYTQKR